MLCVADRHGAFPVGERGDGSRGQIWEDLLEFFDDTIGVFGGDGWSRFVFGEGNVESDGFVQSAVVKIAVVNNGKNCNVFAHGSVKEDSAPGSLIFEDWFDITGECDSGESGKSYAVVDRVGDDNGVGVDGAICGSHSTRGNRADSGVELYVDAEIFEFFCHCLGKRRNAFWEVGRSVGVAEEKVASHHREHESGLKGFAVWVAVALANSVDVFL